MLVLYYFLNLRVLHKAFRFDSGSDSSLVTGLDVKFTLEVNVGVSNVTIKRNRIVHGSNPVVLIDDNATNIFVI